MLRFILDVLLLRNVIQSRFFRAIFAIVFIGLLLAGSIYAYVFVNAALERSHVSHAHAHRTY
jgi:hypothetical protein